MAIISWTAGASSILNKGTVRSNGNIESYSALRHTLSNGDLVVASWSDRVTRAKTSQYLYVYRNGSLETTITLCAEVAGISDFHNAPNPAVFVGDRLWYASITTPSADPTIHVSYYDFNDESSTETFSETVENRDSSSVYGLEMYFSLCRDLTTGKFYVACSAFQITSSAATTTRVWELGTDGTEDHRIYTSRETGLSYTMWNAINMSAWSGTLYIGCVEGSDSTTKYQKYYNVTTATVDGSLTQDSSASGGYGQIGIQGIYGLHLKYGSTTLSVQGAATTWDLSSYIDSYHYFAILEKTSANNDFIVMTWKDSSSTVYILQLTNAGGVTSLASRSGVSLDGQTMQIMFVPNQWKGGVSEKFRSAYFGAGNNAFIISPSTHEVV